MKTTVLSSEHSVPKCCCHFPILITRGRTQSTGEGDVINGYVSCFSSHCSIQYHLVGVLRGHMDLHQLPLISLISWLLPQLKERQETDSFVTMRMWGDFCNTAVHTETVQLALKILCIYVILQSAFHNYVKSISAQWKHSGNSEIFLNQPQSCFCNTKKSYMEIQTGCVQLAWLKHTTNSSNSCVFYYCFLNGVSCS